MKQDNARMSADIPHQEEIIHLWVDPSQREDITLGRKTLTYLPISSDGNWAVGFKIGFTFSRGSDFRTVKTATITDVSIVRFVDVIDADLPALCIRSWKSYPVNWERLNHGDPITADLHVVRIAWTYDLFTDLESGLAG